MIFAAETIQGQKLYEEIRYLAELNGFPLRVSNSLLHWVEN
jgi:hypothetical protein